MPARCYSFSPIIILCHRRPQSRTSERVAISPKFLVFFFLLAQCRTFVADRTENYRVVDCGKSQRAYYSGREDARRRQTERTILVPFPPPSTALNAITRWPDSTPIKRDRLTGIRLSCRTIPIFFFSVHRFHSAKLSECIAFLIIDRRCADDASFFCNLPYFHVDAPSAWKLKEWLTMLQAMRGETSVGSHAAIISIQSDLVPRDY